MSTSPSLDSWAAFSGNEPSAAVSFLKDAIQEFMAGYPEDALFLLRQAENVLNIDPNPTGFNFGQYAHFCRMIGFDSPYLQQSDRALCPA